VPSRQDRRRQDGAIDAGSNTDVHDRALPLALAEIHRAHAVGTQVRFQVRATLASRLAGVLAGAGFSIDAIDAADGAGDDGPGRLAVEATRLRTLPDTVGPEMRALLVGLNPSLYAADRGIPFARPGNRFWPAALAAGVVTRDRDPFHALRVDGIGMTDLVKRATARADELAADEYREGARRVEALVEWLEPQAVCFVGLSGYRVAVARAATAGWQPQPFGGRPAYVMPNPSGLNAHATPPVLAEHLRQLRRGPR
jgi:TDG/mug DNA glycosylase family protein